MYAEIHIHMRDEVADWIQLHFKVSFLFFNILKIKQTKKTQSVTLGVRNESRPMED